MDDGTPLSNQELKVVDRMEEEFYKFGIEERKYYEYEFA